MCKNLLFWKLFVQLIWKFSCCDFFHKFWKSERVNLKIAFHFLTFSVCSAIFSEIVFWSIFSGGIFFFFFMSKNLLSVFREVFCFFKCYVLRRAFYADAFFCKNSCISGEGDNQRFSPSPAPFSFLVDSRCKIKLIDT